MIWGWYFLVAIAGLILSFWIYRKPILAIYLILLFSTYNVFWGELKIPVVKIVGTILFLVWLIHIIQKRVSLKKLHTPHTYLFLSLIAIAYLSSLFSINLLDSVRAATRLVFLFFLYATLVTLISNHRHIRTIIWVMVAAALINMIIGYLKVGVPLDELFEYRLGGLTLDPNFVALYVVTILPLVFYSVYLEKYFLLKILMLAVFVVMIGFVVLSFSRGGFLGLVLVGVMLMVRFLHKPFYLIFLIVVAIAGYMLAPASYKDRISTVLYLPDKNLRQIDGSLENRFNYLNIGLRKLLESPVLGIGLDNFRKTVPLTETYVKQFLHNSYLEMGVEIGLFGLAVFLMLIWETIRYFLLARKAFRLAHDYIFMHLSEALFISFVAFAFGAMFLSAQFDKTFWVLMTCSVFMYQMGYQEMLRLKSRNKTAVSRKYA